MDVFANGNCCYKGVLGGCRSGIRIDVNLDNK